MFPLRCPLCGKPLRLDGGSYRCENRHSYDCAKSGYVNLLDSSRKRSKIPGDNKLMSAARRDFLNKGYYEPLSDALNSVCLARLSGSSSPVILDAGCGEGYYTSRLAEAFSREGARPEILGIDISKFAADLAAKRCKVAAFAAASVFHLPVFDRACDLVLSLFAPYCGEEFLRVLKPGGLFVMAIPGRDHLWELKQAVYETPYKNEVRDYPLDGFEFLSAGKVETVLELSSREDILHLFEMTPYYYKTSKQDQMRLEELDRLTVTASFELLIYQLKNK